MVVNALRGHLVESGIVAPRGLHKVKDLMAVVALRLMGASPRALDSGDPKPGRITIDSTHLKAHRTAASRFKKGMFPAMLDAQKAG